MKLDTCPMWTAPGSQECWTVFGSDRLQSYVRPFIAVAHDRWPRWRPLCEFLTAPRPRKTTDMCGVSHRLDRSITPSTRFLARSHTNSTREGLKASRVRLISRR